MALCDGSVRHRLGHVADLRRLRDAALAALAPRRRGADAVTQRPQERTRRRAIGVVGLAAVVGAFGYLLYGGIGENLVYFWSPGELLAKGSAAYDKPVRLGGQVAPGSVQWNPERLE